MTIYVGKREYLPEDWGFSELITAPQSVIVKELTAEVERDAREHDREDNTLGVYTPAEFESFLNQTLTNHFNLHDYWVRIFE